MSKVFRFQKSARRNGHKRASGAILQFVILLAFWLILSGRYDAEHLSFGVISAGLVTFLSNDLFHSLYYHAGEEEDRTLSVFSQLWRFLAYLPWLLLQIIKANFQVVYLALHPRMPIDPALLQFKTRLQGGLAQVIVANSITLTPGTITVNLEDGKYIIHALVPAAADGILNASIQNKVGAIFGQNEEAPPATNCAYCLEELEK